MYSLIYRLSDINGKTGVTDFIYDSLYSTPLSLDICSSLKMAAIRSWNTQEKIKPICSISWLWALCTKRQMHIDLVIKNTVKPNVRPHVSVFKFSQHCVSNLWSRNTVYTCGCIPTFRRNTLRQCSRVTQFTCNKSICSPHQCKRIVLQVQNAVLEL
jgi:hypothetical protein